ncbi:hypothetical protein [Deinococcus aluminii]|uniref:Uncharacterized protein n=1 Tax=Deinococcus aluminii TaxID=1656885 RepID=A0ABP9XEZ2_9DEIO
MQTTLRLNDELYRRAKAEAARQGITLTRLIERALQAELDAEAGPNRPPRLRTYGTGVPLQLTPEDIKRLMHDADALPMTGQPDRAS